MYFGEPTIDPDEPDDESETLHNAHGEGSELGSVWPVAALFGASSAAFGAAISWVMAPALGGARPWGLLVWCAEHALWGTVLGTVLALVLRLGARFDRELRDPARRRAAAARLVPTCVALALLALAGSPAAGDPTLWQRALPAVLAAGAFGLVCARILARAMAKGQRLEVLPRLDAARVAVLIALFTLPLAGGASDSRPSGERGWQSAGVFGAAPGTLGAPASLLAAWDVMLGE